MEIEVELELVSGELKRAKSAMMVITPIVRRVGFDDILWLGFVGWVKEGCLVQGF